MPQYDRAGTLLLAAVVLTGCSLPLLHRPPQPIHQSAMLSPPTRPDQIRAVVLHVTPCFGRCPSYTYTLNRGLPSLREGFAPAPFPACAVGALSDSGFDQVADQLIRSGFFQLDSVVGPLITDVAYLTVAALTTDGRVHQVTGAETPPELEAVRTTIDSLGATVVWEIRSDSSKHGGCVRERG